MRVTRITSQNEEYFLPLLHEQARKERPGLLRLGVTDDGKKPAGALSAFAGSKDIELSYVYILHEFRRQGYGRALVDLLVKLARISGYEILSAYAENSYENQAFLRDTGFELFEGAEVYQARLGELIRSEKLKKYLFDKNHKGIRHISSLDTSEMKILGRFLADNKILKNIAYDKDFSTVCISDGRVTSVMIAHRLPEGMEMTCIADEDTDKTDAFRHFMTLLQSMCQDLSFDDATELIFMSDDDIFLDIFASLEKNTERLKSRRDILHGIRLL